MAAKRANPGRGGGIPSYDELPPARDEQGRFNVEHYKAQLDAVLRRQYEWATGQIELPARMPKPLEQADAIIKAVEKVHGVNAEHLRDGRTDHEKAWDSAMLLSDTPDAALRLLDSELDAMEREMQRAITFCEERIDWLVRKAAGENPPEWPSEPPVKKKVGEQVNTVGEGEQRLEKSKPGSNGSTRSAGSASRPGESSEIRLQRVGRRRPEREWITFACRAARPLLLMIYVHRSTIDPGVVGSKAVMSVGLHHAEAAVARWMVWEDVRIGPDKDGRGIAIEPGAEPMSMWAWRTPPGHSKTETTMAMLEDDYAHNQSIKCASLHAAEAKAHEKVDQIKNTLGGVGQEGGRFRALHPHVTLTRFDNGRGRMRLVTPVMQKSPSLVGMGSGTSPLGHDLDMIDADDFVPQEDVHEETERERRTSKFAGSFLTRLRSMGGKCQLTGYAWHERDTLTVLCERIRKGEVKGIVTDQKVGGPETEYWSLWPERKPPVFIRKQYNELNDKRVWAANYQQNPKAASARLIGALAHYDQDSPGHKEFLKNAEFILSVDPSGSRSMTSDPTGFLYVAYGIEPRRERSEMGQLRIVMREFVRILDARQFKATHPEVAAAIHRFSDECEHGVDRIVVEGDGGHGSAVVSLLELAFGSIHRVDFVTSGSKGKHIRLSTNATYIDNSNSVYSPVVQFPGKSDGHGGVVPDSRYDWLYRQIYDFGQTAEDHCVDALTQLLPLLGIDRTAQMKDHNLSFYHRADADPRLVEAYRRAGMSMAEGQGGGMTDAELITASMNN